jgi:hypothetical protein
MNNLLAEQIIQDMNNLLAERCQGKPLWKAESHYRKQKAVTESKKALRKAIEEIGKSLTKLGKPLRKMAILGSRFDTRFATTRTHGFTLSISSTHNLK